MILKVTFLLFLVCGTLSTAVPVIQTNKGWSKIVSEGHSVEQFASLGQLHLLESDVSDSNNYYTINLYTYEARVEGASYYDVSDIVMERYGFAATLTWYKDDDDSWKVSVNECEAVFTEAPTPSGTDTYHWIILLTNDMLFIKCNNELLVTLENDECYAENDIKLLNGIGGWELLGMTGMSVQFENIKNFDSCAMPNFKYNTKGVLGIKKLVTAEDCRYDCQWTDNCEKVQISLSQNACILFNKWGAVARYNIFGSRSLGSDSAEWVKYLFGDLVAFSLECFTKKDDPCWRQDVRFQIDETLNTPRAKSIVQCLDDQYSSVNEGTVMWSSLTGRCYSLPDSAVKIKEIPAAGFWIKYNQCQELKDNSDYEACLEYGVILRGKLLAEVSYKLPYDCKDKCELTAGCSAWSALQEIKSCYLYTGPVYKVDYAKAISGSYACLTEFAAVPSYKDTLVAPVGQQIDLLSSSEPGILNLLLLDNDRMRTLHIYQDEVEKLAIEFYPRRQNSEYDLKIDACGDGFNYTLQPCPNHPSRAMNMYQLNLLLEDAELSMKMGCGETDKEREGDYYFLEKDNLVSDCGLDISKWNGIKFENFNSRDMYNMGLPGDVDSPARTYPMTGTTWEPVSKFGS